MKAVVTLNVRELKLDMIRSSEPNELLEVKT